MPANSYTFRSNRITGHAEINNTSDINCFRKKSGDHRCDELLGFVETIHYLKSNNFIDFPVKGEFTSPDVIITSGSLRFGLEVTRLEWQAQAQTLNTSSGKAIPITQALCVDKPLKNISSEDRLKVPGWIGGEMLSNTLALFQARVQAKSEKLNHYRHSVPSNWLF